MDDGVLVAGKLVELHREAVRDLVLGWIVPVLGLSERGGDFFEDLCFHNKCLGDV